MSARLHILIWVVALGAGCGPCNEPGPRTPDARDATTSPSDAPPPVRDVPPTPRDVPSTQADVSQPGPGGRREGGDLVGPVKRAARFRGAVPLASILGARPGDGIVVIVVEQPVGTIGPGYEGDSFSVRCMLGHSPLTATPVPGRPGAVALLGVDPGGDLAETPLWCTRVSLYVPPRKPGEPPPPSPVEEGYREIMSGRAPARWLRGVDGGGKAIPIVDVPQAPPGTAQPNPIAEWLRREEGHTP